MSLSELKTADFTGKQNAMAADGIRHVGDTVVGNEVLRGISGGQRKRLTTGEARIPLKWEWGITEYQLSVQWSFHSQIATL